MEVVWSRRALYHLREIRHYVAQDNHSAADRLRRLIVAQVATLAEAAHKGRPGRVAGTRELVIVGTPYIVAYTVDRDEVLVLAVLHGARRWPETFRAE